MAMAGNAVVAEAKHQKNTKKNTNKKKQKKSWPHRPGISWPASFVSDGSRGTARPLSGADKITSEY